MFGSEVLNGFTALPLAAYRNPYSCIFATVATYSIDSQIYTAEISVRRERIVITNSYN